MIKEIAVLIPVYKPDEKLHKLLLALQRQTVVPSTILLVNTEERLFDPNCLEGTKDIKVIHCKKEEFDHGGTRHMASKLVSEAYLLYMTQDAVPANEYMVEELLKAFADPEVAAAYARQLPNKDCNLLERYTRDFNYGAQSIIKSKADLKQLGIKTFFCSNVCAMYRKEIYEKLGGFVRHTIFNEDMIYAGKLIQKGYKVAYVAEAEVFHSHNYSGLQQFHRNFDLGVSQIEHPEIFQAVKSESEGLRMVKKTAAYLYHNKKLQYLPRLVWQSGCKLIGYKMGRNYRKLPKPLILWCTMNQGYWRQNN